MEGVYTRATNNKTNIFQIQGARAQDSVGAISGISFLNYDSDSSKMFTMASILMYDSYGDAVHDGYGDLAFLTRTSTCNSDPVSEVMRLKHDGRLCLGSSADTTGLLNVGGTLTASNVSISGDLLPTRTQQQNIGSPDFRFSSAWVDTLHLSSNTLYLGTTAVLGTSDQTVNIKADSNQSINLSTSGLGATLVTSQTSVNISTSGMNGQVQVQSTGAGGSISFGAQTQINFTAPTAAFAGNVSISSNVTIGGNLTVTGSKFVADVQTVQVLDNIIQVNFGETGMGVTAGQAGIRVSRGEAIDYMMVFDEPSKAFQVGPLGQLQTLATQPWASSNYCAKADNLSDLADPAAARDSLGLGATCNAIFAAVTASTAVVQAIAASSSSNLDLGCDANTSSLSIGCGSQVRSINVGTGSGTTTINIGGPGDSVNIGGAATYVEATSVTVTDSLVTLNKGGAAASATNTGLQFEEGGAVTGYIKTGSDRGQFLLKSPGGVEASIGLAEGLVAVNDTALVISGSNVGVGTRAPAHSLDVVGSINASGPITQNGSDLSTLYAPLASVAAADFGSNASASLSNILHSGTATSTGWQLESNATSTSRRVAVNTTQAMGYEFAVNGQAAVQRLVVERSVAPLAEGGLDEGLVMASNIQTSNLSVSGALYAGGYCNLPDLGWKAAGAGTLQNSNNLQVDGQVSAQRLVVERSMTLGTSVPSGAMPFGRFEGNAAAGQSAMWTTDVDRIPMAAASGASLVVRSAGWYSVACSDVSQSSSALGALSMSSNGGAPMELATVTSVGTLYHSTRFLQLSGGDVLAVANATASTTAFKLCMTYLGGS